MTRDDHFEEFADHTRVKHFLLDVYLKAWATILAKGGFKKLWFVDAFAGEGGDSKGNPGSPLIAARIAQDINKAHFGKGLSKRDGMHLLAFETDPDRFAKLTLVMEPFTQLGWPKSVAVLRDYSLDTRVDDVTKFLGTAPALYFLDPFGIDGLSAEVLPKLLAGPHNELLILFADEGAVRLAGKARAGVPDEAAAIATAESGVPDSLFGAEETARLREDARAAAKRTQAGHKSNPDAERILDKAYGGGWARAELDKTRDDLRQAKSVEIYEEMLRRLMPERKLFILRFSVDTDEGRHKYFLIHVSQNKRAFAAMKDAMHRTRNQRKTREDGVGALIETLDTTTNIRVVADTIVERFAGRTVRWTMDADDSDTVKRFAIDETPLWMHECDALKDELLSRGLTHLNDKGKPKSPLTFAFAPRRS